MKSRIINANSLKEVVHNDQPQRDPKVSCAWDQQAGHCRVLWMLPQHSNADPAASGRSRANMGEGPRHVGERSHSNSISIRRDATDLQNAGLRVCPPGNAEKRRHTQSALAGILRPMQRIWRIAIQIDAVQQVLLRLSNENKSHNAPDA